MNWGLAIVIAVAVPACSYRVVPGSPSDGNGDASGDAAIDAVVIGDASSNWWDAAWTRRRQVTVQNAELMGAVQSFPLLVRLPAGVDPTDLRVLATDQRTILPHEVDFTSAGGSLIWVRIRTSPTPARRCCGSTTATPPSSRTPRTARRCSAICSSASTTSARA